MRKKDPRVGDTVIFNNRGGFCSGSSENKDLILSTPYKIVRFIEGNSYIFQAILIGPDALQVCVVLGKEYAKYYDFVNQIEDEIY